MEKFKFLKGYTTVRTTYLDGLMITIYEVGDNKLMVILRYHGLPYLYERRGEFEMLGEFHEYEIYMETIVRMHSLTSDMTHWEIRYKLEELYENFTS
jgi:hypothetical protein